MKRTQSSKASTNSTDSHSKWIRTERPFNLPDYVRDVLILLDDAGHVAYVVGGSVRDFLLERTSKDHDIATSASPDEIHAIFPNAITVGKAFGVLKIPIPGHFYPLEIATFRKDLDYVDHRHPVGVLFSGPLEDARRRDFTINALFYDFKTARILDSVGGLEDLRRRTIRAIGDPQERFREDALRLLRAIRFTTQLNFEIESETLRALKARAKLLSKVSSERVRDELNLMMVGADPARAIRLLADHHLLSAALPEIDAFKDVPGVLTRSLKILDRLAKQVPQRSPELAWAALFLEFGKARLIQGYEKESARLATKMAIRLRMSKEEISLIERLIEQSPKFADVFGMREATLQRFVRQKDFDLLLALQRAEATATDGNLAPYEFALRLREEVLRNPRDEAGKLVNGADLIQLGFQPGPRFTEILRSIEDLALEKKIQTKEEALEYVIRHFVG